LLSEELQENLDVNRMKDEELMGEVFISPGQLTTGVFRCGGIPSVSSCAISGEEISTRSCREETHYQVKISPVRYARSIRNRDRISVLMCQRSVVGGKEQDKGDVWDRMGDGNARTQSQVQKN